ncbi:MAG: cation diffusion facilitator family transporter, partial [Acidimicrobiales bacterium]|nr:cation diffusion facilitator family transporter [Acidimicrobiales bacterium]
MSAGGGTRAVVAALVANLGIALAKLVAFVFTRSGSMLAESIHSFADTSNQGLLLLGHRRSHHEPTALHQFGFGRERYFWSFIVSMILFSLGGAFAIYEGIEKIRHPHELESLQWAIGVLLFAIGAEAFSFRTAVQESRPLKGDVSWAQFVR